jgi:hypothetical protein
MFGPNPDAAAGQPVNRGIGLAQENIFSGHDLLKTIRLPPAARNRWHWWHRFPEFEKGIGAHDFRLCVAIAVDVAARLEEDGT